VSDLLFVAYKITQSVQEDLTYLQRAEKRAEAITLMLEDFGLEEERFRLEWISASDGSKFVGVAQEMTKTLKELGPNPYKN
jgi:F420-non-reducing hydrogenase iron-sulfur subunit